MHDRHRDTMMSLVSHKHKNEVVIRGWTQRELLQKTMMDLIMDLERINM